MLDVYDDRNNPGDGSSSDVMTPEHIAAVALHLDCRCDEDRLLKDVFLEHAL